ncbi:MAG: xanthine dehydrogenase accessory protein XdhC, partial [Jannaschia sp.]
LGQCCGGAVILVIERLEAVPDLPWLRRVEGEAPPPTGTRTGLQGGWLREEADDPDRPVWIWGAGHVGLAIARVLAPLPGLAPTVLDTPERMPALPDGATPLAVADMPRAMAHAPRGAAHLILTYSHQIDLALCHAALTRGFASCGLIGSATKWARFRTRLAALGHASATLDRIDCPIGDPALGKHPQAIAVGVAAGLLSHRAPTRAPEGTLA